MSLQQLMAQLQGMWGGQGFTPSVGFLGGMSQQDIANAMAGMYDDETVQGMITGAPQMFQTMTPELMKSASISAYSPLLQQRQGNLASQLMAQLQGKDVTKSYGGFARTGGSRMAEQQVKDVYGKGMTETLTQAMGARTASLSSMQDMINQWLQTAQEFSAT